MPSSCLHQQGISCCVMTPTPRLLIKEGDKTNQGMSKTKAKFSTDHHPQEAAIVSSLIQVIGPKATTFYFLASFLPLKMISQLLRRQRRRIRVGGILGPNFICERQTESLSTEYSLLWLNHEFGFLKMFFFFLTKKSYVYSENANSTKMSDLFH